jgi:Leucine-rich repeat (LRR) protein
MPELRNSRRHHQISELIAKGIRSMTTEQSTIPRPKRRWYQYSLRTLLIIVTLFAVACSWFAVKLQQARRQREAVEAIVKLGGWVAYDYQLDASGNIWQGMEPAGPAWLRKILGDDFFRTVVYAQPKDDASMLILKDLSEIRRLDLRNSQVTDTGMTVIKDLKRLQWLAIRHLPISDIGLINLQGLYQLQFLDMGDTKVTDEGIKYLKDLSQLQSLDLWNIRITDKGLEQLNRLSQLQTLALNFSLVTDNGIKNLSAMTHLQKLDLRGTQVSDAGLEYLRRLPQLKEICLASTKVTDAGFQDLQKALPTLKIER